MMEDKLTQDNEPLTFSKLGLATALIVNRLRNAQALRELVDMNEKQNERPEGNSDAGKRDEQKRLTNLHYVEERLREIMRWERRISGRKV
jgi:hypothetical protein